MKRSAPAALVGLLFLLSSTLTVAPLRADGFSEFLIPDHRSSGWDAFLNGTGSRDRLNSGADQFKRHQLSGNGTTRLFWRSETDTRFTSLDVSASASGLSVEDEHSSAFASPGYLQTSDELRDTRFASEYLIAQAQLLRYLWPDPLGVRLTVAGQGSFGQSWSTVDNDSRSMNPFGDARSIVQDNDETHSARRTVLGEAAMGWGKVRDATGVYEALVIERRLRERGVVRDRLSRETRRRIAALMYLRGELLSVVERPARRVWDELEGILLDDDAVDSNRLTAEVIQRVGEEIFPGGPSRDGLPTSPLVRRRGSFLAASLAGSHTYLSTRTATESFQHLTQDSIVVMDLRTSDRFEQKRFADDLWAGPTGEWHQPIGERFQVDGQGLAMFALTGDRDRLDTTADLDLGAIVADRWLAFANASHARWISRADLGRTRDGNGWSVNYGAGVRFYVEDHLTLELAANEFQSRVEFPSPPPFLIPTSPTSYRRSGTLTLGLRYVFMGRVDAPGVLRPIRV